MCHVPKIYEYLGLIYFRIIVRENTSNDVQNQAKIRLALL